MAGKRKSSRLADQSQKRARSNPAGNDTSVSQPSSVPLDMPMSSVQAVPAMVPGIQMVASSGMVPSPQAIPSTSMVPEVQAMPSTSMVPGIQAMPSTSMVPGVQAMPSTSIAPGVQAMPWSNMGPYIQTMPPTSMVPSVQATPSTGLGTVVQAMPSQVPGVPAVLPITAQQLGMVSGVMSGQPLGAGIRQGPNTIPLAASVPDTLKAKIWANQYFPIRQILTNKQKPAIKVVPDGDSFAIQPMATLSDQEIENLDQWLSAFARYSCVYLFQKPLEGPALFHYQETIRDLAREGGDWRYYDENFRKYRQGGLIGWDVHCAELWSKAVSKGKSGVGQAGTVTSQGKAPQHKRMAEKQPGSFPKGMCWQYHRSGSCQIPNCRFQHSCFHCQGLHPIFLCKSEGSSQYKQVQGGSQWSEDANTSKAKQSTTVA